MDTSDFLNNSAFQNLSGEKLRFLMEFMQRTKPHSSGEMLPFLMGFVNGARKQGISFSEDETNFIIEHLKETMTPQERQKTDMILRMMRSRRN